MRGPNLALLLAALSLSFLVSCSSDSPVGECAIAKGDLVISEVFVRPDGSKVGGQWFEVYNASARAVDLQGVRVVIATPKENSDTFWPGLLAANAADAYLSTLPTLAAKVRTIDESVTMQPGQYGVLTNGELKDGDLWSYGDDLKDGSSHISDTGACIALVCDDWTVVDIACWGAAAADDFGFEFPLELSVATALDPPSAAGNDVRGAWRFARPTRNAASLPPIPSGLDDVPEGVELQTPPEDSIVITEAFINPLPSSDKDWEWIEFYVDGEGWYDLSDVIISDAAEVELDSTTAFPKGHRISPYTGRVAYEGGTRYVLAGELALFGERPVATEEGEQADGDETQEDGDDALPSLGGVPVAQLMLNVSLGNASSADADITMWLEERDEAAQHTDYTYSLGLRTYSADQVGVGAATKWMTDGTVCLATRPYDETWTRFGTPSAENPACGACFCAEGDEIIEASVPEPGELAIVEIMANPTDGGDWLELHLTEGADDTRHLACLQFRKDELGESGKSKALLNPTHACLPMEPGDYGVLLSVDVDEDDSEWELDEDEAVEDAGLEEAFAFVDGGSNWLSNGSTIRVHLPFAADELDVVEDYPDADKGVSLQFSQALIEDGEPVDENDETGPEAWCPSFQQFDGGGGTPGAENYDCARCYCAPDGLADRWQVADPPAADDITITEALIDPHGTTADNDHLGEWVEVHYSGTGTASLTCVSFAVEVGDDDQYKSQSPVFGGEAFACLPIEPGLHLLLRHADHAGETGIDCATMPCTATYGFPSSQSRQMKDNNPLHLLAELGEDIDPIVLDRLDVGETDEGQTWMRPGGSGAGCATAKELERSYFEDGDGELYYGNPGETNFSDAACAAE